MFPFYQVCSVFSNSSSTDFSLCSAPSHPETSRNQISRVEGRVPQSLNPNSQNLKRLSSMLASTPRNHQPVYHKTDAVRSASLWFAAGDWRFGPSIEDGTVWAYATSDVLSGCDRPEFAVNCGDCEITSLRAPSWKNSLRIMIWLRLWFCGAGTPTTCEFPYEFISFPSFSHFFAVSFIFGGRWCQLEILWWPSAGQ